MHCILPKNLEQNQIVNPKGVERRKAIAANKIKTGSTNKYDSLKKISDKIIKNRAK